MDSEANELKMSEKLSSLTIYSRTEEGNEDQETEEKSAFEWEREADVDDDDDDDEDEDVVVVLGFVKKPKNPRLLLRYLFPSKAGGMPAWLDPVNLPSEKSRNCGFCGEPLQFLLQVYAPISEKECAFHRALFVFMCTSMACLLQDQHEQWKRKPEKPFRRYWLGLPKPAEGSFASFIVLMLGCLLSVKVFRCQLPQSNPFYSSEPPKCNGTDKPSGSGAALCSWCGTWKGEKLCGSCRGARYCSEKHQVLHWRSGHKVDCQRMSVSLPTANCSNSSSRTTPDMSKASCNTLWPEFEIVSEDECIIDTEDSEPSDHATSIVSKDCDDFKSLLETFEGNDDKKRWASFQERIGRAPEQVLRYCRDAKAKPLWPMSSGQPSKADIPSCSYCNGPLSYELQLLPQLLYYFGVKNDPDSLDWSTIVVYTCMDSCEPSIGYKEEFAWVQLAASSVM